MQKATNNMTLDKAIGMLSQAADVDQWNETRDKIKASVKQEDWFDNYMPTIDASGLIVEVLGRDEFQRRYN